MDKTKRAIEKSLTLKLVCGDCGHKWNLKPAATYRSAEGWVGVYGSDADFCPKCDGHPQPRIN